MLDFCVGLDTEFSEVVEGSHLYFPKTKFEQVPPYRCIASIIKFYTNAMYTDF